MAKIYLKPGEQFLIQWLPAMVWATGTCADVSFSWTPDTGGEGIGEIEKQGMFNGNQVTMCHWVQVEESSGRLWYDDNQFS